MRTIAGFLSVLIGLLVAAGAGLLLVKAPNFTLFGLGLVTMEWAPWGLFLGFIGLLLALMGRRALLGGLATLGFVINVAALVVLGSVWSLALTRPPAVTSNIPGFETVEPGTFSLQRFLRGLPTLDVTVTRDVVYREVQGQSLRLDVYHPPPTAPTPAPALVAVHGGSWRAGDKGEYEAASRAFAARGFVVVNVAYRLAPQGRFPAAMEDVQCALGFIDAQAERFDVDPARKLLLGRSAGAQIALVAAYAPDSAFGPDSTFAQDSALASDSAFVPDSVFAQDSAFGPNSTLTPDSTFARDSTLAPDSLFGPDSSLIPDSMLAQDSVFAPDSALDPDSALVPGSVFAQGDCPAPEVRVRGVIAYYAPTRMSYYDIIQPELSPGALDDYLGGSPEAVPDVYDRARPFSWIDGQTPPTLLLHGRRDQFVRTADPLELGNALQAAGRPYAVVMLPWANHGFDYNPVGTNSQRVDPYLNAFIEHVLREPGEVPDQP